MYTSVWCHLTIRQEDTPQPSVIHQVRTTQAAEPDSVPVACLYIAVESRFVTDSVRCTSSSATNADVCQHREELPAGVKATWFIAKIRQTVDAREEEIYFTTPPGQPSFSLSVELDPLASRVDALRYICSHPDLLQGYGTNVDAARQHFRDHGRQEGRKVDFDPLRYVASYQDLHCIWPNLSEICEHYINYGHAEGRAVYFEPYIYLAANQDLIGKIEASPFSMTDHYIRSGCQEGRQCSALKWQDYLSRYPDLADQVSAHEAAVARHFVTRGFSESRQLDRAVGEALETSPIA